jgi:Cys-rich protein (TIGR01571 family)
MGFQESFCGCCSRPVSCLVSFFVPFGPCCLQGKSVGDVYKTDCCGPCLLGVVCCCIGAAINRGKIRTYYEIDGNCCVDLLAHIFCSPCAASQEYREVKTREK